MSAEIGILRPRLNVIRKLPEWKLVFCAPPAGLLSILSSNPFEERADNFAPRPCGCFFLCNALLCLVTTRSLFHPILSRPTILSVSSRKNICLWSESNTRSPNILRRIRVKRVMQPQTRKADCSCICAVVVNWAHADARLRYWLGGRVDDGKEISKDIPAKNSMSSSYSKCNEELRK